MRSKPYLYLLIFFSSFLFLNTFPRAVLNPHFLKNGLNFEALFLGIFLLFLSQTILLLFFKNLSAKFAWRLALIIFIASILSVVRMESIYQYFFYSILSGFLIFLFWVPYNIAHFKLTPKENTGRSAAIMFSIGPIISILVPPAAGFLAEVNIDMVWIFTIGFSVLTLLLVNFQTEFKISYSISAALKAVEKVRIFIFLEGIWGAIVFAVVPVYTLFFINTPLNYGIFLAYLGLISVFANLILGHISDRKQKRAIFLYPVTIFLSIATLLLVFASENLALWIVLTGAIAFVLPAFGTLTLSLFIDNQNNLEVSFPGRELILAVGRAIGIGFTFLAFLFKFEILLYIMLGFVMLIFPAVLFYRTKISRKFSYL